MKYWQETLGLQSWDITVKFVEPWKIDEDCTARSDIEPHHLKAKIEIVNPRFHNKEAPFYETIEHLLVHELLHIRLFPDGVKEDTPQNLSLEQGINYLARYLLGLG